jgi:hypothetical protein
MMIQCWICTGWSQSERSRRCKNNKLGQGKRRPNAPAVENRGCSIQDSTEHRELELIRDLRRELSGTSIRARGQDGL